MEANAELLEANIRSLGFSLHDVKIIIISHAHWDHVGALARLKHDTGASLAVMEQDVAAIEAGHPEGDNIYPATPFTPVRVDRRLRDGDEVALGEAALRAVLTPGHTKGCTTWLMRTRDAGRTLNVVFPCSISVAGNVLVGNSTYPAIAGDYQASFQRLRSLPADIVLTNHPEVAGVIERRTEQRNGKRDAFIDRDLLADVVAKAQASFDSERAREESAREERAREQAPSNLRQSDRKAAP
jgi:metallo-beta-lactamase class B